MIFTVEPGIYDSEIGGIRLEDDVLVGRRRPGQPARRLRWSYGCSRRGGALARVHPAHLLAAAAGLPSSTSGGGRSCPGTPSRSRGPGSGAGGPSGPGRRAGRRRRRRPRSARGAARRATSRARSRRPSRGRASRRRRPARRRSAAGRARTGPAPRSRASAEKMGCSARAQAARELELLGAAGPPGDAQPLAPALQRIRLQQRVGRRDLASSSVQSTVLAKSERTASRPGA